MTECRRPGFAIRSGSVYAWPVLKWLKFLIAVLLLPACAGMALALGHVARVCGNADVTWVPFLAGVACWCVIFFLLPKPMWIYVFGHELTHALWTWLCGGKVKKMKVTSNGGHVIVTKTNFLITLAPYFFPLYAVGVIAIFGAGHWFWGWQEFMVYFDMLLGAAYAFHVTLTFHTLQTQQSDVTSQGYLFSAVVIYLGNAGLLLVGIPLLSQKATLAGALKFWLTDTQSVLHWMQNWI